MFYALWALPVMFAKLHSQSEASLDLLHMSHKSWFHVIAGNSDFQLSFPSIHAVV